MSLKTMLQGTSLEDKEFQRIIRTILPTSVQFKTISGEKAFSLDNLKVPYALKNSVEAGMVGTAFDYLARIMIAQVLDEDKEYACLELKALEGLRRIKKLLSEEENKVLNERYIAVLTDFIDYVYSNGALLPKDLIEKCSQQEWLAWSKYIDRCMWSQYNPLNKIDILIEGAYFFAKLEQVYRTGGRMPEEGWTSLLEVPNEIVYNDILNLCYVFKENFIDQGLVCRDSLVRFNPHFGIGSLACSGADADVYIDGTLYDFKTSKNGGYVWQDVAQIVSYYFLNIIAGYTETEKVPAHIKDYRIDRIALYKARYGKVEYCETALLESEEAEEVFEVFSQHLLARLKERYEV